MSIYSKQQVGPSSEVVKGNGWKLGAEVILSEPVSFANKGGYILGCSGQ